MVKWTPDNDQMLLLKILETHELNVDAKKISAAWPAAQGEVPTARAITERLVKIRANARTNGAAHFAISSSQAKSSSGKAGTPRDSTTPATTPRRKIANPNMTPGSQGKVGNSGSPTKRKRSTIVKDESDHDDSDVTMGYAGQEEPKSAKGGIATHNGFSPKSKFMNTTSKGLSLSDPFGESSNGHTSLVQGESTCTDDLANLSVQHDGSPTKKVRRASAIKAERYESDGDAGADDAGSEFGIGDDDDRYEV